MGKKSFLKRGEKEEISVRGIARKIRNKLGSEKIFTENLTFSLIIGSSIRAVVNLTSPKLNLKYFLNIPLGWGIKL
jgi:hypothetical protein